MKVFLSFASPDRSVAERIQLALLGAGHEVFFDQASLPAGSDYNSRIREAIATCSVFVFLISPHSVGGGRYVHTELNLVKAKWPKPWGFVLPVLIQPIKHQLIDPYLAAVAILEPRGNVAAEVVAALVDMSNTSVTSPKLVHQNSSQVSLVAARLDKSKSYYDTVQTKDGDVVSLPDNPDEGT